MTYITLDWFRDNVMMIPPARLFQSGPIELSEESLLALALDVNLQLDMSRLAYSLLTDSGWELFLQLAEEAEANHLIYCQTLYTRLSELLKKSWLKESSQFLIERKTAYDWYNQATKDSWEQYRANLAQCLSNCLVMMRENLYNYRWESKP